MSTERFPLVTIEVTTAFTLDDLEELFRYVERYVSEKTRFAMAVRTRVKSLPEARTMKAAASWVKRNREGMAAYCAGTSIVLNSAALRGAVTFINTLVPPPSPQACFASWEEAEAWALARLEEPAVRA